MGVSTEPRVAVPTGPGGRTVRWLPGWLQSAAALRRLAVASVIANVAIVVTGGAVRLTDSGLGCPTWPSCTDDSLIPTREYAIHGIIEFTNRQLTFVLVAIAAATWVVALVRRSHRRLATLAALGIPAQAVLGGLTVLTHLNPWLVALHFLLSMAIIAVTFLLWWRLRSPRLSAPREAVARRGADNSSRGAALLARVTVVVSAATLALGTLVTGSGPHAGDVDSGTVRRTGLKASSIAQLHADAVMVLIGLTVGLVVLVCAIRAAEVVRRAAVVLLAVELAQGAIGFTQYFLHVPALLVGVHMFGACLVWLAALRMLLVVGGQQLDLKYSRSATAA